MQFLSAPQPAPSHALSLTLVPLLLAALLMPQAQADDLKLVIDVQEHHFTPAELHVPADTRIQLTVRNQDTDKEEFESYDLNREKVIPASSSAVIFFGPLAPGRYSFFGDYHRATAQGAVVVE